jgi:poly(A) polymerase
MQPRFEKRVGRIPESMVAQLRFRAGFDFMRLRADVGEVDEALADWWQKFSTADEDERYDLMEQAREEQKARSRQAQGTVHRVPPRTKAADPRGLALDEGADNHAPDADTAPPPEGSAPKKRRRRRRKPAAPPLPTREHARKPAPRIAGRHTSPRSARLGRPGRQPG